MAMKPRARRLWLTVHVALSIGWLGAVVAYLALDVTVARTQDLDTLRAAYAGMDIIARQVIVPLALASLATGLLMSLGTQWGLFRHYWTVISLIITVLALVVLLIETRTIAGHAALAADPTTTDAELHALGTTLLHSVGGVVTLLVVLALNMYKPRGLTKHGRRRQREGRERA